MIEPYGLMIKKSSNECLKWFVIASLSSSHSTGVLMYNERPLSIPSLGRTALLERVGES